MILFTVNLFKGEGYESLVTEVVPLGKMGQKWDIAMSAVFLCSSAGSFITYVLLSKRNQKNSDMI